MSTLPIDPTLLRQFIPFNAMSESALKELATQVEEVALPKGEVIFHEDDEGPWLYFLLEGQVICQQRDHPPRIIRSGSGDASHALSRARPRGCSAVTETPARLLRVGEAQLEICLGFDQATAYEVFEYDGNDDPVWMVHVLSKPTLRNIPPAQANALFARFQRVPCKAGDVIIQQGDPAEYYYLIRTGHARVSRTAPGGGPSLELAVLGPGEGFGEEALLTGELRNATVTMLTDGTLMRLSREDFDTLLKTPLVRTVDLEEARLLLKDGAQLIDVRLEDEYRAGTLRGSLNLPLYLLRLKAASLDPQRKYILFCQHDQRSSAAAFILAQRGLDAYVLSGGLAGVKPDEHEHA